MLSLCRSWEICLTLKMEVAQSDGVLDDCGRNSALLLALAFISAPRSFLSTVITCMNTEQQIRISQTQYKCTPHETGA